MKKETHLNNATRGMTSGNKKMLLKVSFSISLVRCITIENKHFMTKRKPGGGGGNKIIATATIRATLVTSSVFKCGVIGE